MADLTFSDDDLIQLSLLRDEETDALIDGGFLAEEHRLSSPLDSQLCFTHEELVLQITAGPHYPVTSPNYVVINLTLSRRDVDGLRAQLRSVVDAAAAETNNAERWLDRENTAYGIFEARQVVFEMARATDTHLKELRRRVAGEGKDGDDANTLAVPYLGKQPVSTMSNSELAFRYIGKTAREISEIIPPEYQVMHVEEIIRRDLAARFDGFQSRLRERLARHPSGLNASLPPTQRGGKLDDKVAHLVRPRVTFHGTQRHLVPSIVRHGFLKPGARLPGTKHQTPNASNNDDDDSDSDPDPDSADPYRHAVRCGSTYGRGIYSSPSADFSLSYSNGTRATSANEYSGLKLLVCATIMGRPRLMFREDNWREHSKPFPGADSHVANRELEYIVFDPAQILPVYVVHLDWRDPRHAWYFDGLPQNPLDWTPRVGPRPSNPVNDGLHSQYAGERQRARAAVFAKATKYFPYGYGPATGGKFVVEEVGDVSEDEENYGDYQALRIDGPEGKDKTKTDFWGWVKAAEEEEGLEPDEAARADEYGAYSGKKAYRPPDWESIERADRVAGQEEEKDEGFHLERLLLGDG